MTFEIVDAFNGGQFRPIQRAIGMHHIACLKAILAIRRHNPSSQLFIPICRCHQGLHQGAFVQAIGLGNNVAVLKSFRSICILLLRHKSRFLQQREIDIGFNIAGGTWISVPIPSPAKVSAFLNDAEIGDPSVVQPRSSQHATKTTANNHNFDFVFDGVALKLTIDVGIFNEVGELAGYF